MMNKDQVKKLVQEEAKKQVLEENFRQINHTRSLFSRGVKAGISSYFSIIPAIIGGIQAGILVPILMPAIGLFTTWYALLSSAEFMVKFFTDKRDERKFVTGMKKLSANVKERDKVLIQVAKEVIKSDEDKPIPSQSMLEKLTKEQIKISTELYELLSSTNLNQLDRKYVNEMSGIEKSLQAGMEGKLSNANPDLRQIIRNQK